MIRVQRLDCGKNDVGIAIVKRRERNMQEQVLSVEKFAQELLFGMQQEPLE
jgi:hypothetical protein